MLSGKMNITNALKCMNKGYWGMKTSTHIYQGKRSTFYRVKKVSARSVHPNTQLLTPPF